MLRGDFKYEGIIEITYSNALIFQMRKINLREVKWLVQGHMSRQAQIKIRAQFLLIQILLIPLLPRVFLPATHSC